MFHRQKKYDYDTVGSRLRLCREKAGLSRRELAEMSNCSTFTIDMYEMDNVNPSLFIMADLCKSLNVSLDYITYGKE